MKFCLFPFFWLLLPSFALANLVPVADCAYQARAAAAGQVERSAFGTARPSAEGRQLEMLRTVAVITGDVGRLVTRWPLAELRARYDPEFSRWVVGERVYQSVAVRIPGRGDYVALFHYDGPYYVTGEPGDWACAGGDES